MTKTRRTIEALLYSYLKEYFFSPIVFGRVLWEGGYQASELSFLDHFFKI